ncbi:MAG TPA: biotin/lipoyl-binding protein, partial [Candidatus Baltobacteraceae bacterium]|nr:biotin/lipoyl-binding protein [Candidatus Baltobacteraceae bacterium]
MEERKQPATGAQNPPKKNNFDIAKLDSPRVIVPGAIALGILLFFGLDILFSALTHEKTDDAFIAGHIVSIAPRISGQVSAVHVLDNQMVRSNDLLVEIDPADYATTLAQKKAANISQESNFKAATAGYKLMEVKVATAGVDAKESKADAAAAAATATNAAANFKRAQDLVKQNTISQQEFEQFKTAADAAQANFESAQQKAASDESKIAEAQAQLEAAKAESDTVFAQVGESKTAVEQAQLNLSYTKLFAPCDGRVTRKHVEPGDYLQTGQTLF